MAFQRRMAGVTGVEPAAIEFHPKYVKSFVLTADSSVSPTLCFTKVYFSIITFLAELHTQLIVFILFQSINRMNIFKGYEEIGNINLGLINSYNGLFCYSYRYS